MDAVSTLLKCLKSKRFINDIEKAKAEVSTERIKAPPHNSAARRAMSFPPSAACKFLDLHPVNLRNLHLHLTKNPFASRPPHLRGVTLN